MDEGYIRKNGKSDRTYSVCVAESVAQQVCAKYTTECNHGLTPTGTTTSPIAVGPFMPPATISPSAPPTTTQFATPGLAAAFQA